MGRSTVSTVRAARLSLPRRSVVIGQPARGSRAAAPHRLQALSDDRRPDDEAAGDGLRGALPSHGRPHVPRRHPACEDEITITSIDDRTLRLEGESAFDIRDFGMEPPRIFMFRVDPDVKVRVEVVAEKED